MTFACGIGDNGSSAQVKAQFAILNEYADATFNSAVAAAEAMMSMVIPNVSFEIDLGNVNSVGIYLPTPLQPLSTVGMPDLPPIPETEDIDVPDEPAPMDAKPPSPGYGPEPDGVDPLTIYQPTFGPPVVPVYPDEIPVYGELTGDIQLPVLYPITIPPPPEINIDDLIFQGTLPVFEGEPPDDADFVYVDDGYTDLLIDELKEKIILMINGETGLPIPVEDAIWAREAERENQELNRALAEASDDWASRGFALPGGPLEAKLIMVRQNGTNKRVSLGRDVMIRMHEVLLDQLKFGIAQGIALEDLWMKLYTSTQERKLQAARFAIDIAIAVYNAKVLKYKTDAEIFGIYAEVYKAQIEAELVKAQVYSEQIKAQALIGQINQQQVDLYLAQLTAIETNVKIYLGQIQAYTSLVEAEKVKIEAYRATIEVEQAKLTASELQIRAQNNVIQGQSLMQEAWKYRSETYVALNNAYLGGYQADIERYKGELMAIDSQTTRYRAMLERYTTNANYEKAKADIAIAANEQKVQAFTADVSAVTGYNTAAITKMKAISDAQRDMSDLAIKNAEINAQNVLASLNLLEQAQEVGAKVLSQLAAGAMSAVNVNASISDGMSQSISCNYTTSQVSE